MTITDFFEQAVGVSVQIPTSAWIRMTNNSTATSYVSSAATDASGRFTINNIPIGSYTVSYGPSATGPWTNVGDANYIVASDGSNASIPVAAVSGAAADSAVVHLAGAETLTGVKTVPALSVAGLTGAQAGGRFVGFTAYGPPTSGTFSVGDTVISEVSGAVFVCLAAGSPGTWAASGGLWSSIYDNFQRANGAPGVAPSGQTWVVSGATLPTISSNRLIDAGPGNTSYAMLDNGVTPYQIGANYVFTSGTTDGASLALISSIDAGIGLQNMVHVIHTSKTWTIQIRQAGGAFISLASGTFSPALTADGATVYRTVITYAGNTVYVNLPDGSIAVATDSRISSLAGPRCIWEPTYGATDRMPQFTSIWATTKPANVAPLPYITGADLAALLTNGLHIYTGGILVDAGGITISTGGLTVSGGGITVNAGGLAVVGGQLVPYNAINFAGSGAIQFGGATAITVDGTGKTTLGGLLVTQAVAPGINFAYAATAPGTGAAPTLPANTPTGATGGALKYIAVQINGATAYLLAAQ